ncbi:MAG: PKD domain-containing protein [Bacteroidota bacterium]|nr:PKD domain-containing protein [Bacteroidota bacterium]
MRLFLKRNFFLFIILLFTKVGFTQCISSFPNTQDFEASASWTSGGINSDWAWGSPLKSFINSAGGGSNCWMIGGLSGGTYNGGEKSYIESPCYDFSNLSSPYVSFKIFWEMEYKYDGASLVYSLNNGASWNLVGAVNEPTNCMTQNWYNYSNINYLAWSNTGGWSGNSKSTSGNCLGGSGSLGWVTAKHCLIGLAGKPNVKFRFNFGSGTSCNAFDGFAIDDFTIANAGTNTAAFTYTCSNFSAITPSCSTGTNYNWNFGDALSGPSNTSTLSNPSHTYNEPGVYTVSLTTIGGPCNSVASGTQLISVIGSSISSITNVSCFGGNNGKATVTPLFGAPAYSYTWLPNGGNSATTTSLTAGNYTVLISDANGCVNSNTVSVSEPEIFTGVSTQTLNNCIGDNILLQVNTSGITDPITYFWSPGSYTTNSIYVSPLSNTVYSVNVVISGNCPQSEQKLYTVLAIPKPLVASTNSELLGCAPLCVNFTEQSTTPSGSISTTTWGFDNGIINVSINPTICFNNPGIYKGNHSVTNSYGCTSTLNSFVTVTVFPTPIAKFEVDKTEVTELNSLIKFTDVSSANPIKWEWNFGGMDVSTIQNPIYTFNNIGTFPVLLTVSNAYGCNNTFIKNITVQPEFTFFAPNAFSPNGDGLNDIFLPLGMGWEIASYNLTVYDRWGQKIFYTKDYTKGWDGKIKGNLDAAPLGEYIYKIELMDIFKKFHEFTGFVTILN